MIQNQVILRDYKHYKEIPVNNITTLKTLQKVVEIFFIWNIKS